MTVKHLGQTCVGPTLSKDEIKKIRFALKVNKVLDKQIKIYQLLSGATRYKLLKLLHDYKEPGDLLGRLHLARDDLLGPPDRKSCVQGKSVSLGGRRFIKKKNICIYLHHFQSFDLQKLTYYVLSCPIKEVAG